MGYYLLLNFILCTEVYYILIYVVLAQIGSELIFDIEHLFAQIFSDRKHEPFSCDLTDMVPIRETRKGLFSSFLLKCKMCCLIQTITTERSECTEMDINSGLAVAAISTGVGFSQLDEIAATVNMPMVTNKTFNKYHDKVSDVLRKSTWDSMQEAAEEEANLARDVGDIDNDGVPCITVVTDGAWSKRSYYVNYDALSEIQADPQFQNQKKKITSTQKKISSESEIILT
ncbi:uncharacterized protein [Leptinotarsa decemlineata]|uniref:uncharacterized protein n=1 Tax=Leptinotarsa decemlineata TaxID=7539 RepID=UPI003D3056D9